MSAEVEGGDEWRVWRLFGWRDKWAVFVGKPPEPLNAHGLTGHAGCTDAEITGPCDCLCHRDQPQDGEVLTDVAIAMCGACLRGEGGECHTPGCVFWMCPALGAEQAAHIRSWMTVTR